MISDRLKFLFSVLCSLLLLLCGAPNCYKARSIIVGKRRCKVMGIVVIAVNIVQHINLQSNKDSTNFHLQIDIIHISPCFILVV